MKILEAFHDVSQLHSQQRDQLGRPYIEHLSRVFLRVLERGGSIDQQIAALYHDSMEDAGMDRQKLVARGVPYRAALIVEALTRSDLESYQAYIERVRKDPLAIPVKQADLDDNMDPARVAQFQLIDKAKSDRLQARYAEAKARLESA